MKSRNTFIFAILPLMLAGCGGPKDAIPEAPEPLLIRGELFYPERITLPADSLAVIELRLGTTGQGSLLTEQRIELGGRQVPIPFELTVDRTTLEEGVTQTLRGAVFSRPGPARVTEPVTIDASHSLVDLAPMRLRPVEQVAFGTPYQCGDRTVIFGVLGSHERMIVDGENFDLAPVVSASGARYEALDDPETSFWSQGDRAMVAVRSETLPGCQVISGPALPFTARGQEPSWMLEVTADELRLLTDFGTTELSFPRPEPRVMLEGIVYEVATGDQRLSVLIQPAICADIMSGMPYPYRVRYELDGTRQSGCGGEPRSLLEGEEWVIETLAGDAPVEDSRMTIQFLGEDRVAGQGSCNRYMGGYELTGEGLRFTQMAGTLMACEEPISRQESRFMELLGEVYRFSLPEWDQLVLHATGGERITARRAQ
jgi:heat shock protein HslJ/membrane-bound inhibitor of C-type lysozyme